MSNPTLHSLIDEEDQIIVHAFNKQCGVALRILGIECIDQCGIKIDRFTMHEFLNTTGFVHEMHYQFFGIYLIDFESPIECALFKIKFNLTSTFEGINTLRYKNV